MTDQGSQAPPRRLTRSTTDRMLGGVCGGLAELTGIDPVVFRVVAAVAAIMGGAGIVAYVIAWLVIPSDAQGTSHAESLLHDHKVPRVGLIGIGIVALLVARSIGGSWGGWGHGRHWDNGGVGLLVLVALGLWFWTRDERPASPRPSSPPAPRPPTTRPLVAPDADAEPPLNLPAAPPPPRPPRRRRERSALPGVTISAVLLAGGILAAVQASNAADVSADTALAVCLLVVGAGLLVGSVYGRARGLIALGVLLTIATAVAAVADVPLRGGAGDRRWEPASSRTLEPRYQLGAGDGILDLRGLDLGGRARTVSASVGVGHLLVELPPGVDAHVRAHVGFGQILVPGVDQHGVDVDRSTDLTGTGGGRLELDLQVGIGEVEVTR